MATGKQNAPDAKQTVGRPLNFKAAVELLAAIDAYLGDYAPHIVKTKVRMQKVDGTAYWVEDEVISEQKPVIVGRSALGISRRTLLSTKIPKFLHSIERSDRRHFRRGGAGRGYPASSAASNG